MIFRSPRLHGQAALCLVFVCAAGYADAANTVLQGLPNFQKVNEHVYRGGQPDAEGFASLAAMGVKTIVDLRQIGEHSQADERTIVESRGMRYVSVPMKGMSTPPAESVSGVLKLLESADAAPVFVHCQRGADRTGAVIACYRIEHDGWNSGTALDEASKMGMSWYQRALKNFVIHFAPSQAASIIPTAAIQSGQ